MSGPSSTTNSHLMKTTRRGRPFVKDTHDLYCTLIISLSPSPHRNFFKTYPHSFTVDEACTNLASLKFSQSTRSADPKDPSRIITTTVTTTFSMSRDMGKGVCQYFMDSHLIENAADIGSTTFKDRGIYMCTPKGLHVLERFITKNGIAADHLLEMFTAQPIIMKVLHVERRSQDDEILIAKGPMEVLFRRMAGREPCVTKLNEEDLQTHLNARYYTKGPSPPPGEDLNRDNGLLVRKVPTEKKSDSPSYEYQFTALAAVDWIIDFSSVTGPDEAADILAHFVRYEWINLVSDKGKVKESNFIATVRAGGAGGGAGGLLQEADFHVTDKAIYKITKDGAQAARWVESNGRSPAKPTVHAQESTTSLGKQSRASREDKPAIQLQRRASISDRFRGDVDISGVPGGDNHVKDSHTAKLKQILEEPALRSLFREFLKANFCEENLTFWLDVQDFKRKFNTTSSAGPSTVPSKSSKGSAGHQAMDRHQQDLIAMAFVIYNTYLAPASPCELNIDHQLRAELIAYMNQISSEKDVGKGAPDGSVTLHASQLQTLIKLYERIQVYIFRLMATDSVPKFCKTERYLTLMATFMEWAEKDESFTGLEGKAAGLSIDSRSGMGMSIEDDQKSPTRAYLTISQAANEKAAAAAAIQKQQVGA